MRLIGGVNITEGRLEVCVDGLWGTVCNDGVNEGDKFDKNAARVVCRQLGFPESSKLFQIIISFACINDYSLYLHQPYQR